MLASFLKRDLRNLIQRDASPNFQAQNGLLSLRSWWRSVRSLTTLEDFPEVKAGKLNRERHIPDRDRPHGPYFAKGHRFLLAIDPEHAYALISDILVIGREELCYRL